MKINGIAWFARIEEGTRQNQNSSRQGREAYNGEVAGRLLLCTAVKCTTNPMRRSTHHAAEEAASHINGFRWIKQRVRKAINRSEAQSQ
jgi:hypothetical protein